MNNFFCSKALIPLLTAFFLAGCGVLQIDVENSSARSGTKAENTPVTPETEAQNSVAGTDTDTDSTWIRSTSQLYAISFERPSTWKGPLEEDFGDSTHDGQVRIVIGSDSVEPWDMMTNPYPDGAYVITITYLDNASQTPLGDLSVLHNEIHAWTDLELISNGQSTVVNKLQYTRIDSIAADDFLGLEFIAVTPPYAQASVVYQHLAVLGNSRKQYLIIAGDIPNPGPKTTETWVETFKAVDDRYQEIFRHVVASIRVGR
jgi:hypothetical protein